MDKLQIESTVNNVTVYTDRAIVSRIANVELNSGPQTISITHLPVNVQADSLRISGSGNASVTIVDFRLRDLVLTEVPEAEIRELQAQKSKILSDIKAVTDDLAIVEHQKDFLKSIAVQNSGTISQDLEVKRPNIEDWKNVLGFLGTEMGNKDKQRRLLESKIEKLKKKAAQIDHEFKGFAAQVMTRRKFADVEIEVEEGGEFSFEISYMISQAAWRPSYDARVDSEEKKVEIRYYGIVTQNTGEDWKGVKVMLSTARPQIGGDPPSLSPWYLQVRQAPGAPPRPKAKMAASGFGGGADGVMMEMEEESDESPMRGIRKGRKKKKKARFKTAEVESASGASVVFTTQGRNDIPGNGSEGKLVIMEGEFGNEFRYLTLPKLNTHVYLTAEVENTTEYPLLPGKISIFMDGNFVGNSSIADLVTPEEKFELNLGVDESIKVKHKLLKKKGDEKGLFTKSKVQSYAYLITLENLRNTDEVVVVRDQIPVSQNEKIKVEVDQIQPDENPEKDKDELPNGTVEWKLDLKAKESAKLDLAFSISYPKDLPVRGIL